MRTSEVLNRAADLIEERGWMRGSGWEDHGSGLCLEGGIVAAAGLGQRMDMYRGCPAYEAVAAYLGRVPTPSFAPISDTLWGWNDTRGSASEVIEVLRACAVIEAAKEQDREPAEVSR